jgi:hypothetical protein
MIGFADYVRIKISDETQRLDLAGRKGQIYGFTTPSSTGVPVIGSLNDDYAVNIYFEELEAGFWFTRDLIDPIDHGVGTVVSLAGQGTEWIKLEVGNGKNAPVRSDRASNPFLPNFTTPRRQSRRRRPGSADADPPAVPGARAAGATGANAVAPAPVNTYAARH